jgi:HPt (histidine-containing phosphotransfer) domain-containing protein
MPPIDLARLRDFSDGTETGLRDLAGLFVTHLDECLEALRQGAAVQDAALMRTEAHRGAGTFGACGAQPLSALLSEVETLAATGQLPAAVARLPQVEAEVARVREFLDTALEPAGAGDSGAAKGQP